MGKMKYLVIHTTDTPFNREVTPDDIVLWHLGARHNPDGTFTYLSKTYSKSQLVGKNLELPSGKKVQVLNTNGRGWSQVGYSDMINRKGELINLVPYNFDDTIDSKEITNGASGYNSCSRHVVLVGGWSKDGKVKTGLNKDGSYMDISELYTPEQIETLKEYILMQKSQVPTVEVVGHNNLASKTCPNFNVQNFLKTI